MNAFHVFGGVLAVWALLVSFLGITREGFPASRSSERVVLLISFTLFVFAVGAAVLTAVAEHNEEEEKHKEAEHALALPD